MQLASSEVVRAKCVVKQRGDGALYVKGYTTQMIRWRRIGEKRKAAREGTERSKDRIPDQREMHLGETRDVEKAQKRKTRKALTAYSINWPFWYG